MIWETTLFIKPQAKQSVRFGRGGRAFTDPKKRQYVDQLRGLIESRGLPERKLAGPVRLDVTFVFPFRVADQRRSVDRIRMDKSPDRGNLLKPLEDALKGVVIADDNIICEGDVSKQRWRDSEGEIHIRLTELPLEMDLSGKK